MSLILSQVGGLVPEPLNYSVCTLQVPLSLTKKAMSTTEPMGNRFTAHGETHDVQRNLYLFLPTSCISASLFSRSLMLSPKCLISMRSVAGTLKSSFILSIRHLEYIDSVFGIPHSSSLKPRPY